MASGHAAAQTPCGRSAASVSCPVWPPIPGPTLIINGERDLPFRLFAPAFAAAGTDVRRVRLARARHLANLDQPAAFNEAIRRFVRSLEVE